MSSHGSSDITLKIEEPVELDSNQYQSDAELSTSTLEDAQPDEFYTYLQDISSDNLMKLSQQSALHELMLNECSDIKPRINTLPMLCDHDYGGYNFQMLLAQPHRVPWVHSKILNKMYIRMNQTFNIDVAYKPKMPIQPLRLRVFLCYTKDISMPVLRCQNHMCKETGVDEVMLQSLIRCENPATEYCGNAEGKSIADRITVLVPLSPTASKDEKVVRQTTAFKFTCQNSCFGRKETSMVFCLENMNGEILGQRVLDLKICSCPKRDKSLDERHYNGIYDKKRKIKDDTFARNAKMRKCNEKGFLNKDDSSAVSDIETSELCKNDIDVRETKNGGYRMVITYADRQQLLDTLRILSDKSCVSIVREPDRADENLRFMRKCDALRELHQLLP